MYIEILGVIAGLFYVYFQINQRPVMWIVCFLTAVFYMYVFYEKAIYANMFLQLYYVAASVYGLWLWKFKAAPEKTGDIVYRRLTSRLAALVLTSTGLLTLALYYLLSHYTDSSVPLGDAFTASVGIVATWMLAHRIIEHWMFWIVSDSVSIYVCWSQGLYPSMFLYVSYIALAVYGYITWRRKGVRRYDSPL